MHKPKLSIGLQWLIEVIINAAQSVFILIFTIPNIRRLSKEGKELTI
jgi:hypothetical protein